MRVLLVSHTCQSLTEGQPKADALATYRDLHLRVIVPDRWRHYGSWRSATVRRDAGFKLDVQKVRLPWAGPAQFYMHWYPGLATAMREFKPDVIDLWEEPWGLVSAHTCWLRNRLMPATKIVSETEQNVSKKLPFPFEQMRRYTLRNADFAVGRSSEAIEILRSKGFNGPAEVVPNAVDATLFRPLDRGDAKRLLGINGFVAGYVGRLVAEKGLMDLVAAIRSCPDDVHLVFVGSGPLKEDLARFAEKLGKGKQLHLLPARPAGELPILMNAMDVLVLPSRTTPRWKEQFGRVIIEASACGIPVIGSNSGAIPEVVGAGGIIVPENNPEAIAQAIIHLRSSADLGRSYGIAGRRQVESLYTWDRVAERMRAIYLKVYAMTRPRIPVNCPSFPNS